MDFRYKKEVTKGSFLLYFLYILFIFYFFVLVFKIQKLILTHIYQVLKHILLL